MPRHLRPDISDALRKVWDVDPPGSFETVSPEVVPVYLVGNLEEALDIRQAMAQGTQGAVALERPHVGLHNIGTNVALVVTGLWIDPAGADDFFIGFSEDLTVFSAASTTRGYTNLAYEGANGQGVARTGGDAAINVDPFALFSFHGQPLAPSFMPIRALVTPGKILGVVASTVNTSLAVCFQYQERPLIPADVP